MKGGNSMWSQVIDDVRCVEEPSYEELLEKNKKLEKALDKACEFLAESHVEESGWSSKDKWKEWAMKDE